MKLLRQIHPVALLIAVCISVSAFADKISDIHPVNYVTDLAGVLDANTSGRINALAGEVERKTGAQIAVVTVKSLDGRPVEDYAVELFKHLGVGHKDDRGVLLLVAPHDRKYRIEVGYGLEPAINDARAGDIGRAMVPYLRANDYNSAIAFASGQLASLVAEASNVQLDQAAPPVRSSSSRSSDSGSEFPWWLVLAVGAIAFPFIRAIARGSGGRRRRRGGGWWYGGPGMGGWGGGGWSGGGGWGGGGSFGGGSFGGFGGGSSGGGGASGSW